MRRPSGVERVNTGFADVEGARAIRRLGGVVIAESDDIVEVEGNAYFPLSALDRQSVLPSSTHSVCPWKGVASYFSLKVGDAVKVEGPYGCFEST